MRTPLLTTAAILGLALATPAFAQSAGTAPSGPDTAQDTGNAPADQAKPAQHHMHHAMQRSSTEPGGADSWSHEPGTGQSGPASTTASNIDEADSHSAIAPHFPSPKIGASGSPEEYLMAAQNALARHQTGAAQQALEMAETRLLDRSTPVNAAGQPDQNPMVASVAQARQALGTNDVAGASNAIKMALASGK